LLILFWQVLSKRQMVMKNRGVPHALRSLSVPPFSHAGASPLPTGHSVNRWCIFAVVPAFYMTLPRFDDETSLLIRRLQTMPPPFCIFFLFQLSKSFLPPPHGVLFFVRMRSRTGLVAKLQFLSHLNTYNENCFFFSPVRFFFCFCDHS